MNVDEAVALIGLLGFDAPRFFHVLGLVLLAPSSVSDEGRPHYRCYPVTGASRMQDVDLRRLQYPKRGICGIASSSQTVGARKCANHTKKYENERGHPMAVRLAGGSHRCGVRAAPAVCVAKAGCRPRGIRYSASRMPVSSTAQQVGPDRARCCGKRLYAQQRLSMAPSRLTCIHQAR